MAYNFRNKRFNDVIIPVLPGASTVTGMIGATDIGKLCVMSSNTGLLALGTTGDSNEIIGIITGIGNGGTATTSASTVPFYVAPIMYGEELEADFSTSFSTGLPATTDIGKYIGFSTTLTVAGAASLDMSGIANAPGTSDAVFFKITGFDVDRRKVFGIVNSTHLAL